MKVLIADSDLNSLNKTKNFLELSFPGISLIEIAQSIRELNLKLDFHYNFDLIITEVQFSDGLSFDAFENRISEVPIIFTNYSDQFALRSFEFNCLDYILKPVVEVRLMKAFSKFKKLQNSQPEIKNQNGKLHNDLLKTYKKRFLTKVGNKIRFVSVDEISYLFSEDGLSYLIEKGSNQKSILDHGMVELETELLDPSKFYRINRSVIINSEDLMEMKPYLNSRLILTLKSKSQQDLVVARERVSDFKKWVNQ